MNEFEALKRLRQETCPATYMPDFNKEECLEVIEKALLELKAIKEAKPSKALKALDRNIVVIREKDYTIINQALLKQLSGSQYTNIFIDEAVKPSEALEWLNQQIQRLNDDLQHYTMVEKDKAIEYQISEDLKELNTIKQALLKAEKLEKAWEVIKPLCEVVETPKLKNRYLKINGVVVYAFHNQQEFEFLTEVLE